MPFNHITYSIHYAPLPHNHKICNFHCNICSTIHHTLKVIPFVRSAHE